MDGQFEKSFADLALAYQRDKAPYLMNFMLGFQVLEKNDDETRAAGLFGYAVGSSLYYAPVFFINGELRGHELLYLKQQDIFLPFAERWVNYLLGKQAFVLGEPVEPARQEYSRPDFSVYGNNHYKSGSYTPLYESGRSFDATPFLSAFEFTLDSEAMLKQAARCDLPTFIQQAPAQIKRAFLATMKNEPEFCKAVTQFYKLEDFNKRANTETLVLDEVSTQDVGGEPAKLDVQIIVEDAPSIEIAGLDETEKLDMLTDGFVARDHRKDTASVYAVAPNRALSTPKGTGMYMLYDKEGEEHPCYVFNAPVTCGGKGIETSGAKLVVEEDTGQVALVAPTMLATEYISDFAEVKGTCAVSKVKAGDTVFFTSAKQATVPVIVSTVRREDGDLIIECRPQLDGVYKLPEVKAFYQDVGADGKPVHKSVGIGGEGAEEFTLVCSKSAREGFTQVGTRLFAGGDVRAYKAGTSDPYGRYGGLSFRPGTPLDFMACAMSRGGAKPVRITKQASAYYITLDQHRSGYLPKLGALLYLTKQAGVSVTDARRLLGEAASREGGPVDVLVKASFFPEEPSGTDPYTGVPMAPNAVNVEEYGLPKGDRAAYETDPRLDPEMVAMSQRAAQTGQKEVFDASVLAGLLRKTRVEEGFDKYLGDLFLAVDRLGRLLFMYYWHYDKFSERYGVEEMKELESSLKDSFSGLGDLVLFLKKRAIDPGFATKGSDVDLG